MKASFSHLEEARVKDGPLASQEGQRTGVFLLADANGVKSYIKADCGSMSGWEHVSVSSFSKIDGKIVPVVPSLISITAIKLMFWDEYETVVMFFSDKVHGLESSPTVHLWKSKRQTYDIPKPELFTPQEKPDNVIPLPTPSQDGKTP